MSTAPQPAPEAPKPAEPIKAEAPKETLNLQPIESFLKKVGHIGGVILADVVKYAPAIETVVTAVDPAAAPVVAAFNAAVALVKQTVLLVEQKWVSDTNDAQKLADVLTVVQAPIVALFAKVGKTVDAAYITKIITGVVAFLDVYPAEAIPTTMKVTR